MTLRDVDLMYVLTLLRSSDVPMSTEQLIQALKDRSES